MREELNFEKNQALKKLIAEKKDNRNEESVKQILSEVLRLMVEDSSFLVPVVATKEENGENRLNFRTIADEKTGKKLLPVFTDLEEVRRKNPVNTAAMPIREVIHNFVSFDELDFIIINPWGESFPISKQAGQSLKKSDNDFAMKRRGIYLHKGDIADMKIEAIVNSADPLLNEGDGVDHAIYSKAGDALMPVLDQIGSIKIAEVKTTPGYDLNARWIFHTVGPVYTGDDEDKKNLEACYRNVLDEAKKRRVHSIAFPAISCGASGYPIRDAVPIAILEALRWLRENPDYGLSIVFCSYTDEEEKYFKGFIDAVHKQKPETDAAAQNADHSDQK